MIRPPFPTADDRSTIRYGRTFYTGWLIVRHTRPLNFPQPSDPRWNYCLPNWKNLTDGLTRIISIRATSVIFSWSH